MTKVKPLHIAYSDAYLDWKLGTVDNEHPSNPVRAQLATRKLVKLYPDSVILDPIPKARDAVRLMDTHPVDYITNVVNDGVSTEWPGTQPELGETALTMFAGTVRCVDAVLNGDADVAFNPQGAKHHAQYDYASGFCVFNDFAWAAQEFVKRGWRVLYIDIDAHHGDGVENLTRHMPMVTTASIHDGTIFPGTGRSGHTPELGVYNWAFEADSGDAELNEAMLQIEQLADEIKPDIILLAAGADGHETDPLATLNYSVEGYRRAAEIVANIAIQHAQGRVLVGGAGGYTPFDVTPTVWATVVSTIYNSVQASKTLI